MLKRWLTKNHLHPALILVLIVAGILPYLSSLNGDFVLDDQECILGNRTVHQLWPLQSVISGSSRPLVKLTFALNFTLGGPKPFGFHLFNLFIHLCSALLVFGVLRRTLLSPSLGERFKGRALLLAFATALLWEVHPINTAAVTYIWQRSESMMALFYLLTMYGSIRYFEIRRPRWLALAVGASLCGMASKAIMVTAPIMVVLYDRMFFSNSFVEGWKKHGKLYWGLAASWTLLLMILSSPFESEQTVGFSMGRVSFWEYLFSQPGIILHYLRLIFWPHPLILDYRWPVAQGFFAVVVPAVFVSALIAVTVRFYRRGSTFSFLGVWFFLILVPTSGIIPIADLAFEHRVYLSSVAVIAAVLIWLDTIFRNKGHLLFSSDREKIFFCVVAVGLGVATHLRNLDYHDRIKLWEGVLRYRPQNARALFNYGLAYFHRGDKATAMEYYEKAAELDPDVVKVHANLANMYFEIGQTEKAMEHGEKALLLDPEFPDLQNNYGVILMEINRLGEAEKHLVKAVEQDPNSAQAAKHLGNVYYLQKEYDRAVPWYLKALELDPGMISAMEPLADIYLKQRNFVLAERTYQSILLREGPSSAAYNGLGAVYTAWGRRQEAIEQFREALRLDPGNLNARSNLNALTGHSQNDGRPGIFLGF